jgi:hypothetical protein
MNQSDLENINLFEICQQQSQCYLLIPPPRPPTFPQLFFPNSSSIITNLRQRSDLFFILLGIFISTCLTLVLLGVKYEKKIFINHLYVYIISRFKLRHRHRRTTDTNTGDGCASLSSVRIIIKNRCSKGIFLIKSNNYLKNIFLMSAQINHFHIVLSQN